MTAAKKYIPVNIPNDATYQLFRSYSELTGVPISKAIREAMKEYAEIVLAVRLETLTDQLKARRSASKHSSTDATALPAVQEVTAQHGSN
jgi:hypothetical protein